MKVKMEFGGLDADEAMASQSGHNTESLEKKLQRYKKMGIYH